jgi:type II secretory pathway component GspD/PulD (secretin)
VALTRCLPALIGLSAVLVLTFPAVTFAELEQPVGSALIRPASKPNVYEVNVSNEDVKFVLEMLSRESGANIVVSPEVTGKANVHLKAVTVEEMLDVLAKAQGLKWEKNGSTYLVGTREQFEKLTPPAPAPPAPEPETLVWECRNIRPADTAATLKALFTTLNVAEGPSSVTPLLPAKSGAGNGGGDAGGSADTAGKSNSAKIIVFGPPAEVARARDLLKSLDVPRKQVSLQVSVTELSASGGKELGINWTWTDLALTESEVSGINFGKFTKSSMTVNAAVSALVKDGRAKLLAQPNISVIDNEKANILIGDRVLYPKLVGYSQVGTPIYDKEEEEVGIELQIAPKIAGDQIVLTLYPQVSLITGYLKTQAGDYPQISTREARTTVAVDNGATLAIGGLLRDNDIKNVSKVPLLSNLPILGQFFRQTKTTRERTEIVILVTPKIIDGTMAQLPGGETVAK